MKCCETRKAGYRTVFEYGKLIVLRVVVIFKDPLQTYIKTNKDTLTGTTMYV